MKAIKTWVVLASSETARFLVNLGPGKGLTGAGNGTLYAEPPRQFSDRAGKVHSRVGPGRSAVEQPDPKALAETEFADAICDYLQTSFDKGEFARLVVVAGPHMLGKIRKALPERISEAVVAEIDKDLTRVPVKELPDHLKDVMAV